MSQVLILDFILYYILNSLFIIINILFVQIKTNKPRLYNIV